jgi:hypothetical protein
LLVGLHEAGKASSSNDTFCHGSFGSADCIFEALLSILHFSFGGSAHSNHGNTAGKLRQAFFQFLSIELGRTSD